MVMVENICAVEKLDYGALGKSNMGQIIHRTPDENTAIIYFQAKVRGAESSRVLLLRYGDLHWSSGAPLCSGGRVWDSQTLGFSLNQCRQ